MVALVIGLGYAGAVTAAVLSKNGLDVTGIDRDDNKVNSVNSGKSPVSEPGLSDLIREQVHAGRLRATNELATVDNETEFIFLCLGTPSTAWGDVDLSQIDRVMIQIQERFATREKDLYIINRSTMLPRHHEIINSNLKKVNPLFRYMVHPEFLREGNALEDALESPRVVFGAESLLQANSAISKLYPGLINCHVVSISEAAMVKYADNCFHSLKIAFANEVGRISSVMKCDSRKIMDVFCSDSKLNISTAYLKPGKPFGGSCLYKDVSAIANEIARLNQLSPLISSIVESNTAHVDFLVRATAELGLKRIGLFGVSFKEGTDDVRNSPAIWLADRLFERGIQVELFDELINPGQLVGVNREKFEAIKHANFHASLKSFLDSVECVVLMCQPRIYVDELRTFGVNNTLLDVVDCPLMSDLPGYQGICW